MKHLKTYKLFESDFNFNFGDCEIYAIALHRLYGYPLYVVNGYYKEPDWDEEMGWTAYLDEPCHVVVKLPNGKYLDAQGETTEDDLKKACLFSNEVEYIKIEPISEEEAKYLYTGEDKEDYIQEVITMIKSNESYQDDSLNSKLLLDDILNVQDCFRELEDDDNFIVKKTYYDVELEEWLPTEEFEDIHYSIDFYITKKSLNSDSWEGVWDNDEMDEVISAIKRAYDLIKDGKGFGKDYYFNIQYREMKRSYHSPSDDKEIEYDKIESIRFKDIYSISFTLHTGVQ